jgi:hypothetical protein
MLHLKVYDVGDGNHLDILSRFRMGLKVDYGSLQEEKLEKSIYRSYPYFFKKRLFLLSHFHSDYYNGLIKMARAGISVSGKIKAVFYPRLPEFPQNREFMRRLLYLNRLLLGDPTPATGFDLFRVIRHINGEPFKFKSLSQGEVFPLFNREVEVLWPPKEIVEKTLAKSVDSAVRDFDSALALDPLLATGLEKFEVRDILDGTSEYRIFGEDASPLRFSGDAVIPPEVLKAGERLRKIANRFSLAFRVDDTLLFLGELENNDVNKVLTRLKKEHFNHCSCIVTPHHGTSWGSKLTDIFTYVSVVSSGSKYIRNYDERYKLMSESVRATFTDGDVFLDLEQGC